MAPVAKFLVGVVAALHLYFLVLEMFLWKKPIGRRVFGLTREFAEESASLAANQGLYNGFLAAGLAWGLYQGEAGRPFVLFFLGCALVAGIFGAITVNKRIFFVQGLPALVALMLFFKGD